MDSKRGMSDEKASEIWGKAVCALRADSDPKAAATVIQSAFAEELAGMEAEIARLRESNRLMGDVIDFACREHDASDAMDFIDKYREDKWQENTAFVAYRDLQARAALGVQPNAG